LVESLVRANLIEVVTIGLKDETELLLMQDEQTTSAKTVRCRRRAGSTDLTAEIMTSVASTALC
jgi:hypothetical protein